MTPEEKKDVAEIVSEAVNQSFNRNAFVDRELHESHHDFIARFIAKEDRSQQLRESVKKQVVGWSVIVLISGIGYFVYDSLMVTLQGWGGGH